MACGGGGGGDGTPRQRFTPSPTVPPTATPAPSASPTPGPSPTPAGTLQHLIFIVQENRSFDNYFGTYPGANGIPTSAPCQVDPWYPSACDTPYPNHEDSNQGGPYTYPYQVQQVDGGKMDGFVAAREAELGPGCKPGADGRPSARRVEIDEPELGRRSSVGCQVDVMGYHDGTDLPNYWAYARENVLLDNFYESIESFSLPAHLALFSGWSADCVATVTSCVSSAGPQVWNYEASGAPNPIYLWTDITYLLWQNNVSWRVYNDGVGIVLTPTRLDSTVSNISGTCCPASPP